MKKILLAVISFILIFNTLCPITFAESEFKITKGSILNGEAEAPISALITYEFTEEIDPSTVDTAEVSDNIVKDASAVGKKLYIRLNNKLKYNTSYTINLSGIKSAGGLSLPVSEQTVSFKTKPGASKKIIEEDFETLAIDTKIWRAPGNNTIEIAPVDSSAGNGNYSYKLVDKNLDMFTNNPLFIDTKAILDFDVYFNNLSSDYKFFSLLGNDGATNTFESSGNGMLKYDAAKKELMVYQIKDTTTYASGTAMAVKQDAWNNIRVVVDMKQYTFRVILNGSVMSDGSGTTDFDIPCVKLKNTPSTYGITNVRLQTKSGVYYDNISYREYLAPKLVLSTVNDNASINASSLAVGLSFDTDVEALSFKLNDAPVSSDAIKQNSKRTFTCYLDDLSWGTSYCLTGTVSALYDTKREFTINFITTAQPSRLIEVAGFYDDGGDRLFALSSGEVTAKVKIWQGSESASYTIVAGLYRKQGEAVEMLGLNSADYTLTASEEKTIKIDVPAQTENLFVKIFALNNSTSRIPYQQSELGGNRVLE